MTGANRVSSLYASVAEAGDEPGVDPSRPAAAGPQREGMRQSVADVAGGQERGASPARRGKRSAQAIGTAARRRSAAAGQAPSRKTLLRRAALAGVAIVLLGVGLVVSEEDAPPPAAPVAPVPDPAEAGAQSSAGDNAGGTATPPGMEATGPGEGVAVRLPPLAAPAEAATPAATGDTAGQSEAAPIPITLAAAGNAPASQSDGADAGFAPEAGTAPTPGLATSVEPAAAAAPPPAPAVLPAPSAASARALARGYVVQLGVFGDPDNAETLSRELAVQGYPAHLQSRVVLGPFSDQQAAKAAAERLRRDRKLEGIVVPPRKP